MKLLKALAASAVLAVASHAQVLISDFSDFNAFTAASGGTGKVLFAGGGLDSWIAAYPVALDFSSIAGLDWQLVGNVNAGNTATSITVALYNADFSEIVASAVYTVGVGGLTTAPSTLVVTPAITGALGAIGGVAVAADGNPSSALNLTLDNLSVLAAVPEPSQVALGLGALAIGAAVVARRRKA